MTSAPNFEEICTKLDNKGLLSLARVAESSERYPDMCILMKKLVKAKCKAGEPLLEEERNLLSVAYKNVIGSKRSSWRTLKSETEGSADKGDDDSWNETVKEYQNQVEGELQQICQEVISLVGPDFNAGEEKMKDYGEWALLTTLDKVETKKDSHKETEVFYLKMIGDYCRYLAEIDNETAKAFTEVYYGMALEKAEANLAETHPTRLGLSLNYSVCFYEIMKKPEDACALAKKAFDGAIEKLDTLNDASYKDSTLIMQLLRDNLTLWTSDGKAEENP